MSELDAEAEFEREAAQLFKNLGLKIGPETLSYFQGDIDKVQKSEWKSGLKQPSRRRRTSANKTTHHGTGEKGSTVDKETEKTPREHHHHHHHHHRKSEKSDRPLNGSSSLKKDKQPTVLTTPPRSPHSQRRARVVANGGVSGSGNEGGSSARRVTAASRPSTASSSQAVAKPVVESGSVVSSTSVNDRQARPVSTTSSSRLPQPTTTNPDSATTRIPSPTATTRIPSPTATTTTNTDGHWFMDRSTSNPDFKRRQQEEKHRPSEFEMRRRSASASQTKVVYHRKSSFQLLSVATTSSSRIAQTVTDGDIPEVPKSPEENSKNRDEQLKKKLQAQQQPAGDSRIPSRIPSPISHSNINGHVTDNSFDRPRVLNAPRSSMRKRSTEKMELILPPSTVDTSSNGIYDHLFPWSSIPDTNGRKASLQEVPPKPANRRSLPSPGYRTSGAAENGGAVRRRSSVEAAKEFSAETASLDRDRLSSETPSDRSSTPGGVSIGDGGTLSASSTLSSVSRSITTPESVSVSECETPDSERGSQRSCNRPSALPVVSALASDTVQALSNLMEVLTPSSENTDQPRPPWEELTDSDSPLPPPVPPFSPAEEEVEFGENPDGLVFSRNKVTSPWYIDPEDDSNPVEATSKPMLRFSKVPKGRRSPPLLPPPPPPRQLSPPPLPPRPPHLCPPPPPPLPEDLLSDNDDASLTGLTSPTTELPYCNSTSQASLASSSSQFSHGSPAHRASPTMTSIGLTTQTSLTSPRSTLSEEPIPEEDEEEDFFGYCAKCEESVIGMESGCLAAGNIYHTYCFSCSRCLCSLVGEDFYTVDKEIMCELDYLTTLDKCHACKNRIKDRVLKAFGHSYHPRCFKCSVCGLCLDGIPYANDAAKRVYCIQDFHRVYAPRCEVCKLPIVPEAGKARSLRVLAMDRSYHVGCYKCEDCERQLAGQGKTGGEKCYPFENHMLCKSCYAVRVESLSTAAADAVATGRSTEI